jgi:cell division septum initiation protein DivIVA
MKHLRKEIKQMREKIYEKEREVKSMYEDMAALRTYGRYLEEMYQEEEDEIKKNALYFAMNVMGIKEYQAKTDTQDMVIANLQTQSKKLEKYYIEHERKLAGMNIKILALVITQIIVAVSLVLVTIMR